MAVAYPIAVTIGNLVDPPATMVNAAGDYAASFLVARITEGSGWLERTDGERAAYKKASAARQMLSFIACASLFEVGRIHHDGVVAHNRLLVEQRAVRVEALLPSTLWRV